MADTRRTYLQWKEAHNQPGWNKRDARPFDIRRFFMENGRRISKRTLILEPGIVYRGRRIIDCAIEPRQGDSRTYYLVECQSCGQREWILEYTLARCSDRHCFHCAPRDIGHLKSFRTKYPDPEPGAKFGELTVLQSDRRALDTFTGKKRYERMCLVQCSCGTEPYWVLQSNLRSGKSTRCDACAKKKARATQDKKYWGYADICPDISQRRRLLARIAAQINRCNNPNDKHYESYGGRGIKFCFASRRDCLAYLVTLPGWDDPNLEIDRIDNDGNYEVGNIQFVSRKENVKNHRRIDKMQQRINELEAKLGV